MQNHQVTEVESHKHLGIHFASDCTWHQHIDYIKQKAWLRINIMRKLKFKLDRKALETFYLVFLTAAKVCIRNGEKKEEH